MTTLISRLSRLPGIGKRSAERMAFYLLKQPAQEAVELAAAITDLKRSVHHCSACFTLAERDPCPVCADPARDRGLIMVVEQPSDAACFEATGTYRGLYHVLMGRLSPLDGIGPGELNIEALIRRIQESGALSAGGPPPDTPQDGSSANVREVILGTSPTLEGDGTALYLAQRLDKVGVKVTRLARGLPTGWSVELASKAVLADSIHGRQAISVD